MPLGLIKGAVAGYGHWAPRARAEDRAAQVHGANMQHSSLRMARDHQALISDQADRRAAKVIGEAMLSDDPLAALQSIHGQIPAEATKAHQLLPELIQRVRARQTMAPAEAQRMALQHQNALDLADIRGQNSPYNPNRPPTWSDRTRLRGMGQIYNPETNTTRNMTPEELEFMQGAKYRKVTKKEMLDMKVKLTNMYESQYDNRFKLPNGRISPIAPPRDKWVRENVAKDIKDIDDRAVDEYQDPNADPAAEGNNQPWPGIPWRQGEYQGGDAAPQSDAMPAQEPVPFTAPADSITGAQPSASPQPDSLGGMINQNVKRMQAAGGELDFEQIALANPARIAAMLRKKSAQNGIPAETLVTMIGLSSQAQQAVLLALGVPNEQQAQ